MTASSHLADDIAVAPVDAVALEARAAELSTRSIKKDAKRRGLELAISMTDLTTLEGMDSPGKVAALCGKAMRPAPGLPSVAAVCVYPDLVAQATKLLAGSSVAVASVATGFPSGRTDLALKLSETRRCVEDGADEIDMVIDRGAFLSGDFAKVFDEIAAVKEACDYAHLKVILETGELATYDNVRLASEIAMRAGGDFIKTSTGKVSPASTMPVVLLMLEAVRDFYFDTGKLIGVKAAGGIKNSKQALRYLAMVNETVGDHWLTPSRFRFGASSLLNDLLMQLARLDSGTYQRPDDFSKD
ncbi:MAG: 2-deoxyribose-5-phosphate aldolase [Planctomycetota bacterium]|nr:MAG: 2-deoxyribose-5-phosphate aldolase [Planctomycetota bacterium]